MTNSVRIGLIGTSWWMDMAHLPLFKADDRVQMVAMCGRNQERAQAMVDAILEKRPLTPSFYEGWKAQQVIDAVLRSDESGQWVSV